MGATSPERHREVAVPYLSERPHWSDALKSLALLLLGDMKSDPEQPLAAIHPGRSRSPERLVGVTSRGRCASLICSNL
uniref:Uncharacterized protein n=1 Tax=Brassica campestris TaxID=3711 RepID=M4EHW3_BRACM